MKQYRCECCLTVLTEKQLEDYKMLLTQKGLDWHEEDAQYCSKGCWNAISEDSKYEYSLTHL